MKKETEIETRDDRDRLLLTTLDRFEKLSREHQMLLTTLKEEIQPTVRFYQSAYTQANQVMEAVKHGSVKTPGYTPPVEEGYWDAVRRLVVQAVYSIYNKEHRPTKNRREVVPIVQDKIKKLRTLGKWPRHWKTPGRDTIIRRLNEAADVRHYPDGVTPVIAVAPGRYLPSPLKFEEPIRSQLEELAKKWRKKE